MKLKHLAGLVLSMACVVSSPGAQQPKALHASQIQGLVAGGVDSRRVAMLVDQRGIDFQPSAAYLDELKKAGAGPTLLKALQAAKRVIAPTTALASVAPKPATPHPAAHALSQGAETPKLVPAAAPPVATAKLGSGLPGPRGPSTEPSRTAAAAPQATQEVLLAAQLGAQKDWPGAERQYRAALETEPKESSIHLALGRVLAEEKKWNEAISEYHETLSLSPDDAGAHRALAAADEAIHNPEGAIAEYRALLRLNPNDAALQSLLGERLYERGDASGAADAWRAAARLEPGNAEIENRMGLALFVSGDVGAAIAAYRQALTLRPSFIEAHNNLGDALLRKGDRQGALEQYHLAFDLAPNDSTFRASYAQMQQELKH